MDKWRSTARLATNQPQGDVPPPVSAIRIDERVARSIAAMAMFALAGCSSSAAAPDVGCKSFDDSTYTPGSAQISFKDDVVPVFAQSCSVASCHGLRENPSGGLYLGPNVNNTQDKPSSAPPFYPPDGITLADVHGRLVGVKGQLPVTMVLVAAGTPRDSFLMHKIDGDQSCSGIPCKEIATGDCGEAMPQRSMPLETRAANTIRDWILQGAPNR
jgi:hypothetical protein